MKLIVALVASLFAVTAFAQDKGQPVYGKTTPNPVVTPAKEEAKKAPTKSEKPAAKNEKKTAEPTKPAASK